jgi:hypothetical protein
MIIKKNAMNVARTLTLFSLTAAGGSTSSQTGRCFLAYGKKCSVLRCFTPLGSMRECNPKVEIKIVPVHAVKVYGGAEIQLHSFLSFALDGGG